MGLSGRYSIQPSTLDESSLQTQLKASNTPPETYVKILAREKALAVRLPPSPRPPLVIGADTIVVSDGSILEKPRDAREAAKMLSGLVGKWHEVLTGVALILDGRESVFCS